MSEEEQNIVTIVDENGSEVQCEVYDIVEYEDKMYALMLPLDEDEEEAEFIVLEYVEEGDECFFRSIDDEDEFDGVSAYIQSLNYDEEFEDNEEE